MPRNRKRRGESRPADADPTQPVATARDRRIGSRVDDTSDPMGHSAPDAELAEAQLAAGEAQAEQPESGIPGVTPGPLAPQTGDADLDDEEVYEDERHPAVRPRSRNRLIAFAQGSWRELQRVQWPDQRAVVQATGVVIGFVIVAGAYLGLADWVATKIVNFILS